MFLRLNNFQQLFLNGLKTKKKLISIQNIAFKQNIIQAKVQPIVFGPVLDKKLSTRSTFVFVREI